MGLVMILSSMRLNSEVLITALILHFVKNIVVSILTYFSFLSEDSKRLRESKSGEKNKSKIRMGGNLLSSNCNALESDTMFFLSNFVLSILKI